MSRRCKVICVDKNVSVFACGWGKEEGMTTGKEEALGVLGVLAVSTAMASQVHTCPKLPDCPPLTCAVTSIKLFQSYIIS